MSRTGLIMEGGAMRGMFTAGVTDVLMENGIEFDGAIGVSAGAVFGCNYKSHQIGRVIRYNKKYCRDKRYVSLHSWITTGNLYGVDFAYRELPETLDPFDAETFRNSPMEFYVVCTDADTGRAVYHKCENGDRRDIEWMRASATMPLAGKIVNIGGQRLSDGGTADSIPAKHFCEMGYARSVAILTQPAGYVKQKNSLLPVLRAALHRYPALVAALADRHMRYNETLEYIAGRESAGELLVIRPEVPLNIGAIAHDENELERVYQHGRAVAIKRLDDVRRFVYEK